MSQRLFAGLLVAAALVGAGCDAGDANEAAQHPSPSASASAQPLVDGVALEPGSYNLVLTPGLSVTFDVEAGWSSWPLGVFPTDTAGEPPAGAGIGFWLIDELYGHVCNWASSKSIEPGDSPAEQAAALASQGGRAQVTEPIDVEIDGRPALQVELTLPADKPFSDCAGGEVRSWRQAVSGVRYHQGPGQVDQVTLVDLGAGKESVMAVGAAWFPDTPGSVKEELGAIVESVRITDER